eukprot:TRINITY_DN4810_c0_g1_i1.p1 TRINITY_DN4810_c0_g1~~TRINITY_DN4810_c0_g1_i1.p1  ORF type:complete len:185 (+),score=46.87 TRINITY_DN4810_c0_g1_i1:251-805(+)
MGDKQSKAAKADTSSADYQARLREEQARMLTVSSLPVAEDNSNTGVLAALHSLEKLEPVIPGKLAGENKKLAVPEELQIDHSELVDMLAGFQTVTKQNNGQLLTGTFTTIQKMRDIKQHFDTIEKRLIQSNSNLNRLQSELQEVTRIERSIDAANDAAIQCADLINKISDIVLREEAKKQPSSN